MSTPNSKKIHLFFYFFLIFFIFSCILFLTKKQRGGKCTEKEKPGGGWNGRKRGARKLRLRRYGTVRPERGAGRRRTEDVPGIKKAPPCGGKAFLNEKKLRMRRRTEPLAGRGTPVGDFSLRPDEYKNKKYWLRTVFKK